MIKKFKQFNESLLDKLRGPNYEELVKWLGSNVDEIRNLLHLDSSEKIPVTPEEFVKEYIKNGRVIIIPKYNNSKCVVKGNEIIFQYDEPHNIIYFNFNIGEIIEIIYKKDYASIRNIMEDLFNYIGVDIYNTYDVAINSKYFPLLKETQNEGVLDKLTGPSDKEIINSLGLETLIKTIPKTPEEYMEKILKDIKITHDTSESTEFGKNDIILIEEIGKFKQVWINPSIIFHPLYSLYNLNVDQRIDIIKFYIDKYITLKNYNLSWSE